ncbi:PRA1 family [Musa troglodytarum]|uniref:PRA1 family protein n=1 Tax=Musa troglodytarum TaxID=320322 RepID=A0A9E7JBG6_9LILI|nr:PRA1 family [Musa troglodytarum]
MAFASNPLSLSVSEPAFEAWLRDTGYLEILDDRAASADHSPSSSSSSSVPDPPLRPRTSAPAAGRSGLAARAFSSMRTLASLFTLNPFAKLTPEDLSGGTPSWTLEFIGVAGSYSWPAGSAQARMRVQENVRRYVRNYALLSVIVFACTLYKMPVSLLGLIACLVLWEFVRFCSDKWQLEERSPGLRQAFVHIAQLGE